jgi:hypothetical protein
MMCPRCRRHHGYAVELVALRPSRVACPRCERVYVRTVRGLRLVAA